MNFDSQDRYDRAYQNNMYPDDEYQKSLSQVLDIDDQKP